MTIEINQFDEVFFDETYGDFCMETEGLLVETERLILGVDIENPDMGELNSIASALRLLKELAVMFYSIDIADIDMTEISHVSENFLDKICKNEIVITVEHVNALLAVKDLIETEIDNHRFRKQTKHESELDSKITSDYSLRA
jgi:two-component system chemotaxis sensor kinase CheA